METLTADEIIRTNVKLMKAHKGFTYPELAELTGLSRQSILDKQAGRRAWRIADLDSVASAFDTTPWDLLKPMLGDTWRPRQESNLQPRDCRLGMRWVNTFF